MYGQCPMCFSNIAAYPSLKLMVNVCGHQLCVTCVDMLFYKGSGYCPQCKVPLRRNNFRIQLFENPNVDNDIYIRRRLMKVFNKLEEDFENEDQYNDYLEQIEEIVYNLTNNINVIETNKMIENYKRENREQINRNQFCVDPEVLELEKHLLAEQVHYEERIREVTQLEQKSKNCRDRMEKELRSILMRSGGNAEEIVNNYNKSMRQQIEESKKLPSPKPVTESSTGSDQFLPVPRADEGVCSTSKPLDLEPQGPSLPNEQ